MGVDGLHGGGDPPGKVGTGLAGYETKTRLRFDGRTTPGKTKIQPKV